MSKFSDTFTNAPSKAKQTRSLLVIGGITYKNYAIGDLIQRPEASQYYTTWKETGSLVATGGDNAKYSMIKEINCEALLDRKLTDWMSKLLLLGIPFRLWDRFGDYFKIIWNKTVMKRVTKLVEREIAQAKSSYGDKVDVIAHSLGTLILLASDVTVDNAYLLGSPLTSRHWSIRHAANDFWNNNDNLVANNINYCFSENDIVGTHALNHYQAFRNIDCDPVTHSFSEYLDILLKSQYITL